MLLAVAADASRGAATQLSQLIPRQHRRGRVGVRARTRARGRGHPGRGGGGRAARRPAGATGGTADVVIGPAQLALQIHESVGHALELDRILGDETNFAGTLLGPARRRRQPALRLAGHARSWPTPRRPAPAGAFAFDDEGTPATRRTLIEDGVLRDVLSSRDAVARHGGRETVGRCPLRRLGLAAGLLRDQRLPRAGGGSLDGAARPDGRRLLRRRQPHAGRSTTDGWPSSSAPRWPGRSRRPSEAGCCAASPTAG